MTPLPDNILIVQVSLWFESCFRDKWIKFMILVIKEAFSWMLFRFITQTCKVGMLLSASLCAWGTVRPNKPKHLSLEPRKVYCKETGGSCPQNCELLKDFGKALLNTRGKKSNFSCCNFLVWESFVLTAGCPHRSGHCSCKSPTRQMLFSALHLLTSIWMDSYRSEP